MIIDDRSFVCLHHVCGMGLGIILVLNSELLVSSNNTAHIGELGVNTGKKPMVSGGATDTYKVRNHYGWKINYLTHKIVYFK